jgi:hypothetical protein
VPYNYVLVGVYYEGEKPPDFYPDVPNDSWPSNDSAEALEAALKKHQTFTTLDVGFLRYEGDRNEWWSKPWTIRRLKERIRAFAWQAFIYIYNTII